MRQIQRDKVRRREARELQACLDAYGGKCVCCGETEPVFLTIDHPEGDGAAHRRAVSRGRAGAPFRRWLRQQGFPPGYQLLCANCQLGKERHPQGCPHTHRETT